MYYDHQSLVYLNGEFKKATEATTDLYSQSLHYGYAVFEGIRSYRTITDETKIFKAEAHFLRLKASAEALGIPFSYDIQELIQATYVLLEKSNLQDAYIRPIIYCPANMGLSYPKSSTIMIAAWQWGALLGDKRLKVMTSSFQRPNPGGFKIEAKVSGHYVNSILASEEARTKGYDEALLLDIDRHVAEGPGANIFFEKDGILYTPPRGNILPGITRATVLEICATSGIKAVEEPFGLEMLKQADHVFFCGTAAEIVAWESLDNHIFKKEWQGSVSNYVQQVYQAKVRSQE